MTPPGDGVVFTFRLQQGQTYRVDLHSPQGEGHSGAFTLPYSADTWAAVLRALEPDFSLARADSATQAALQPLVPLGSLTERAGQALAVALLADPGLHTPFDSALRQAEAAREPLPVVLRFDPGCHALIGLPWELLHHQGRFLVADSSIALSRCPAGTAPPAPALAALPLRVLPARAREQLVHGLRALDEEGAVIVDLLRPPTYDTLIEAVTNGGYHMLVFYGHGAYDPQVGGRLLFEDEFGGRASVMAAELGVALRNTDVRLVLLGACQSAQVSPLPPPGTGAPATAPALLQAGVPLAIGMQVSMHAGAAQAFICQFALSLAAGKGVGTAVADARKPLIRGTYGRQWFAPALYGRPAGADRLFDQATAPPEARTPLPEATADLRAEMKGLRAEMAALEQAIGSVGVAYEPAELARLRAVRQAFARKRAALARRAPGGYAQVTSPLYGVPSNPVFVGRSGALRRVAGALHGERPAVVWGAAGIGKTALAVEVAHRQGWRFPAGVLWLDCRGGPPFDALLNRLGAFCGLEGIEQVEPGRKEEAVRHALARLGARCLLVWDNAEEVWGERAVREFVAQRLPANCQALLTTREDPEQAMWPTVELPPLADAAMTELFERLATAAGVRVGGPADMAAIPQVVAHLQGHPLAMTLVVPLMHRRGIARVWRALQERPLQGVEAAFALSYDRLSDLQQRLFARLGVFVLPFEWEASEALLPGEASAGDALDALVRRALVAFDGARHACHALLRQYAYARLCERGDPRPVHRLAAAYLQAKLSDPARGGTPEEALEEMDQWEKAEAWEEFTRRASTLVGRLDRFGYWAEIRARLERALAVARAHLDAQPERAAVLLNNLGIITSKQAEWDQAIEFYQKALETTERIEDTHGMAKAFGNLGNVYLQKGEWKQAIAFYEKDLEISERLGDIHGMAQTYANLGTVYAHKGEWEQAIAFYEKDLEISERLGDIHGMAGTYTNLGGVYRQKGEWERAITLCQKALETMEQVGDIHGMAQTYTNLGLVYADKGEWEQAIALYQKVLETMEQVGDIHGMATTYMNLGNVYARKGRWDQAIVFYQNALQTMERLGDIHGMATTYMNLGNVYTRKGRWDQAIAFYEKSLETKERVGDIHGTAQAFGNLGTVYARKGEWERAIGLFQDALDTMERVGNVHGMAQTYMGLGNVYAAKGEWERAIELYQDALDTMERLGDVHGMAQTHTNLGIYYQAQGNTEQAAHYMARAYLLFARLGAASDAEQAGRLLVDILGSVEAANACLAQVGKEMRQGQP
jgi:tetratricopeptide (TPR) repeat protein